MINKIYKCCWLTSLALVIGALSASAQTTTFYVNFGEVALSDTGWNSVTLGNVGTPLDLVDSTGASSSLKLTKTSEFKYYNNFGYADGAVEDFVAAATLTTLYGENTTAAPQFIFSGLDPDSTYDFKIFASRGTTYVRTGNYAFTGLNTDSVELDAVNNASTTTIFGIIPDVNGEVLFDITAAASNTAPLEWVYINAMSITAHTTAVPEPSTYVFILGILSLGAITWNRRIKYTK